MCLHRRRENLKTSVYVGHSTKTGHLSIFTDIKTNVVCLGLIIMSGGCGRLEKV